MGMRGNISYYITMQKYYFIFSDCFESDDYVGFYGIHVKCSMIRNFACPS